MSTYRFRRQGVTEEKLASQLPMGTAIVVVPALPKVFTDIQVDPDCEGDLVSTMHNMGWDLFQKDPTTPLRGVTIIQNYVNTLAVDRSINSGDWEDLLTLDLNTEASALGINGTISSTSEGGDVLFRLLMDGNPVQGLGHGAGLGGNAFNRRMLAPQGVHQVKLQWKNLGLSAEISPVTKSDRHHATLMVSEVVA